jgi:putative hemolysin
MEVAIPVGLAIIIALTFLATVDMAFSHLSDLSLRRLASEAEESNRPSAAEFLRQIIEHRSRFRLSISSSIQFLLVSFTVLVTIILLDYFNSRTEVAIAALVISILTGAVFRQVVPRLLSNGREEDILLALLPAVRPLYMLTSLAAAPFISAREKKEAQRLEHSITPEAADDRDEDNSDDLHALMEVGEAEGIIEEKDRELIESMVEFSDTRVAEIMTPRTEIVALPIDSTVRMARDLIVEQKYSRLPVYRESIDNIEGVLYVRDLIQAWALAKEDTPVADLLRPAYFVPETKPAADLLKNMQVNHIQIAFVIDEYGGIAGVVTVEDIVEEIVGEIEDEDIEEEEIIEIIEGEGGYYDVLGSTDIGKIERLFGMEIEDDDFSTIAGLVTSEAGYVPREGERLVLRGLEAEILKADEKRIHLVRLRRAPEPVEEAVI